MIYFVCEMRKVNYCFTQFKALNPRIPVSSSQAMGAQFEKLLRWMSKMCKFEQRLTSYLFKFIKYAYSIYRDLTGCYRW